MVERLLLSIDPIKKCDCMTLKSLNLEGLQRVYPDHSFGVSKASHLSSTLAEGVDTTFGFAQVML